MYIGGVERMCVGGVGRVLCMQANRESVYRCVKALVKVQVKEAGGGGIDVGRGGGGNGLVALVVGEEVVLARVGIPALEVQIMEGEYVIAKEERKEVQALMWRGRVGSGSDY